MKLTKTKVIWICVIILALIFSYFYGGNYNEKAPQTEEKIKTEANLNKEEPIVENTDEKKEEPEKETVEKEEEKEPEINKETEKAEENFCTLLIRCDTIKNNLNLLSEKKHQLIPENGIILDKIKVSFNEGESVFNVLRRETKKNKIHLEFSNTPVYNSVYIEGIANLYEFDVGELSGWVYKVNGISPGYASSEYVIKAGDEIEWLYTCDLGKDVNATVQITK